MITFLFPFLAIFRLLSKLKHNENPEPTLVPLPKIINSLFKKILFLESSIIKKLKLPFGLSVICVAKKLNDLDKENFI